MAKRKKAARKRSRGRPAKDALAAVFGGDDTAEDYAWLGGIAEAVAANLAGLPQEPERSTTRSMATKRSPRR